MITCWEKGVGYSRSWLRKGLREIMNKSNVCLWLTHLAQGEMMRVYFSSLYGSILFGYVSAFRSTHIKEVFVDHWYNWKEGSTQWDITRYIFHEDNSLWYRFCNWENKEYFLLLSFVSIIMVFEYPFCYSYL